MSEKKLKLVIGLGNIGAEYAGTRHNFGFTGVEHLATLWRASWHEKSKFQALIAEANIRGHKVLLVKPTTYYNLSGEAAAAITRFYKIALEDILVIHDELDLPFGTVRTRIGGSDAGNNGIKSLNAHVGTNYARIRLGIGNGQMTQRDAASFVLDYFLPAEQQLLPKIMEHVTGFAEDFIADDADFLHTSIQVI